MKTTYKHLYLTATMAIVMLMANALHVATAQDTAALRQWKAGQTVEAGAVARYGIDRCFTAQKISDKVFARMWTKSYKSNCTVPRSQLRYLKVLHYTLDGQIRMGEMVCDKGIARDLLQIFRALYDARYPIERMTLVDDYDADDEASMAANNTTCFNFRFVTGTKKLSNHSKGRAIDINPLYNPYVKKKTDGTTHVEPAAGRQYTDRDKAFDYKIDRDDLCYKLFVKHGFEWGGSWKSVKDYQHFEKSE